MLIFSNDSRFFSCSSNLLQNVVEFIQVSRGCADSQLAILNLGSLRNFSMESKTDTCKLRTRQTTRCNVCCTVSRFIFRIVLLFFLSFQLVYVWSQFQAYSHVRVRNLWLHEKIDMLQIITNAFFVLCRPLQRLIIYRCIRSCVQYLVGVALYETCRRVDMCFFRSVFLLFRI